MYLAKIEQHFSQKRGQGLILSPKDWQIAKEWYQEGIPLAVVLRGINRSFEQADSGKQIRSLAYCDSEVKRIWQEYKEQRQGAPLKENSEQEVFPSCLLELSCCLRASEQEAHSPEVAKVLRQVQLRIQELLDARDDNWEAVLKQLTKKLICRLKELIAPQELVSIEAEAKNSLQGYEDRMSKVAYEQTLNSLASEQLLAKYNLHSFSLYAD